MLWRDRNKRFYLKKVWNDLWLHSQMPIWGHHRGKQRGELQSESLIYRPIYSCYSYCHKDLRCKTRCCRQRGERLTRKKKKEEWSSKLTRKLKKARSTRGNYSSAKLGLESKTLKCDCWGKTANYMKRLCCDECVVSLQPMWKTGMMHEALGQIYLMKKWPSSNWIPGQVIVLCFFCESSDQSRGHKSFSRSLRARLPPQKNPNKTWLIHKQEKRSRKLSMKRYTKNDGL